MPSDDSRPTKRRDFLKLAGASAVVTTGIAGCVGTENGGTETPEPTEAGGGGGGGGGATETMGGGETTETAMSTSTPSGPDTITIGQPGALTGQWDFLQPAVSLASDVAVQEINDAGGPLGAEFTVSRRDTAVNPQQARTVVRQLINNDNVPVINGLFSSEIVPMWDFLQEQQVPVVTPWPGTRFLDTRGGDNNTPEDTSDDGWVWRTVIGDTVHTAGAAKAMIDAGYETMGMMNGTTTGERGWTDAFEQAYQNLGGTIAKRVEVSPGQSSYQSSLNVLFQADFDAWGLAFALEDATTVIRDWANAGYGKQLLLEDGLLSPDLPEAVGSQAEGALIAAGSTQGPNYGAFETKFNNAGDADIHTWGVASYDAVNVIALAIHRAGEATPEAIQQNLGAISREGGTTVSTFGEGKEALDNGEEINYEGAVTQVDFTKFGNVWGDVGVQQVTPDGFEQVNTVSADTLKETIENY